MATVSDQLNAETTVKGKKKTILERFREEQSVMIPSPTTGFDSGISKQLKVSKQRRKKQRLRRASFPALKFLQDLQRDELPTDGKAKLPMFERLDFIRDGQNIIFAGNPGTGKTHLATALGIKACMEDFTVFFTTVHALLTQIRESRSQKTLRQLESRFEKYNLVICDEFGYVSFDKQASEILFTHLSLRAGRKSTIITTNLAFDRWKEIFGDEVLTAAMVDRLTHKAFLVNMNGESFRLKETSTTKPITLFFLFLHPRRPVHFSIIIQCTFQL